MCIESYSWSKRIHECEKKYMINDTHVSTNELKCFHECLYKRNTWMNQHWTFHSSVHLRLKRNLVYWLASRAYLIWFRYPASIKLQSCKDFLRLDDYPDHFLTQNIIQESPCNELLSTDFWPRVMIGLPYKISPSHLVVAFIRPGLLCIHKM